MAADLRANREGYRRWSRVAWAATGVLWALLFFAGPDQVASNTFIDRMSDGSAAPDSLFQYVAEHHAAVGALLIAWLSPTFSLWCSPPTLRTGSRQ